MLPSIQQQLKDFFPQAELLSSISPDQVIAVGASKQVTDLIVVLMVTSSTR